MWARQQRRGKNGGKDTKRHTKQVGKSSQVLLCGSPHEVRAHRHTYFVRVSAFGLAFKIYADLLSVAACHQPPYALNFYSNGKMVLFVTVCWSCHNIAFIVPDVKHWVDFQADSQAANMLKEIFEKAFPAEKKFG